VRVEAYIEEIKTSTFCLTTVKANTQPHPHNAKIKNRSN
jgi:hypothetical protein